MTRGAALAALLAALAGCVRTPPPAPQPRYLVGGAYQAGGAWFYPREDFAYEATGLAAVAADRTGPTANGERFSQDAAAAAHPTLQLPSVLRVTNLENGRQLLLRANDRGPSNPARLIELTRRAASLLGVAPGGTARVHVQVEPELSQRLADELRGPALRVAAAPRGTVRSESLAPPPGTAASPRGRGAAPVSDAPMPAPGEGPTAPLVLPDEVAQLAPRPGRLWIRAGEFGRMEYADRRRAQLSGLTPAVERVPQGRGESYRVKAGPFATVGEADAALDRARRAGVTDAQITVE